MPGLLARLVFSIALLSGGTGLAPAQAAGTLPSPSGDVVLTVTGAIAVHNDGEAAVFDMAMLEALPRAEIVTETPWTEGTVTLAGFRLLDLLELVGSRSASLTAFALNDYETEIPVEDARRHHVLVAYLMDGEPLPPSNKGPLWIVYPFSSHPELQGETYYARSLWSLERLEVE